MDSSVSETREDVLHVPNLFDFFCQRCAEDMLNRGSAGSEEAPATSFAGLVISFLMAMALYIFGKPALAKAAFVFFGALMAWTVWGVVIRSTEQISQKSDNIKSGVFSPDSLPVVIARLKWWNHLITPLRWGRHSRLFDRRGKLERKIGELQKRIEEALAAGQGAGYTPPTEEEILSTAASIATFSDRSTLEAEAAKKGDPVACARAELIIYLALLHKLQEMTEHLDRIEKLTVVFHNVSPEDLSQIVSEAIQMLEDRRIEVLNVDKIDPEDFIDLVTVRSN